MRQLSMTTTLLLMLMTTITHAALPPLSEEMRQSMATDIVTGTVAGMSSEVVELGRGGMSNRVYRAMLEVTDVAKGDLTQGHMIQVTFWRSHTRPSGWAGPGGQYGDMALGASIKAYMIKTDEGVYALLEPNGFDVVSNNMVEIYNTVRKSGAMREMLGSRTMRSMTIGQTYRCPGCYRFDVVSTRKNGTHSRTDSLMTEMDLETSNIRVTIAR